jgi:hypothetical protein
MVDNCPVRIRGHGPATSSKTTTTNTVSAARCFAPVNAVHACAGGHAFTATDKQPFTDAVSVFDSKAAGIATYSVATANSLSNSKVTRSISD